MNHRSMTQFITAATVMVFAVSAFAGDKSADRQRAQAGIFPPALSLARQVDEVLKRFGNMVTAYNVASGQEPVTIEIDFLGNQTGNNQLPADFAQWVRDALDKLGSDRIRNYRLLPAAFDSQTQSGIALPQLLGQRPKPPQATFRLTGIIEGSTQVFTRDRNGRLDGTAGGGHTAGDSSLTLDHSLTVTAITIGLTLELPNGIAVPGATAVYRIDAKQTEKNHGFSFYVGGNGFGLGSDVKVTQDPTDALYYAVAMNVVQVLGNGLGVPYYLCSSSFLPDTSLDERVRGIVARKTQADLERQLKRYMIVDGYKLDRQSADFTSLDRAKAIKEMSTRGLAANGLQDEWNHAATIELMMQFWRSLDFQKGASMVEVILADTEWRQREVLEQQERTRSATTASSSEFGWPANVGIVVVDLSRVPDPSTQARILAVLQMCGCGEIRKHPTRPYLAVKTSDKAAVQYAIGGNRLLSFELVWLPGNTPHLLVAPLASK